MQFSDLGLGDEEGNLLTVWYLRVRDSKSRHPIVQDQFALDIINKIEVDLSRSQFKLDATYVRYVASRSKQLDEWTSEFLSRHQFEDSLVLQLSCGLDNRYQRVTRAADVKWIDVEKPKVVNLRNRLLPRPEGDYDLIAALVGEDDDTWLKNIPRDRPTLIIMESLLYYFEPNKALRLLKRLLGHFQNGNIVFDTFGSVSVTFGPFMPVIRNSDTRLKWGIDDAEDILKLDKRLVLRERIYAHDCLSAGWFGKGYPPLFGGWTPLISLLPKVSHIRHIHSSLVQAFCQGHSVTPHFF